MSRTISLFFAAITIVAVPAFAGLKEQSTPTKDEQTATETRHYDFTRQPVPEVLRTLARDARMKIVVADSVSGTVTMRIEDKTPREVMEIIVEACHLVDHCGKNGIHFIQPKHPAPSGGQNPATANISKPANTDGSNVKYRLPCKASAVVFEADTRSTLGSPTNAMTNSTIATTSRKLPVRTSQSRGLNFITRSPVCRRCYFSAAASGS